MKNFILPLLLMAFLSACRSAHSVSKVAESAQTTETTLTSAVTTATLTDFISTVALQADSLIMLMQPDPLSRTPVLQGLPDSTLSTKPSRKPSMPDISSVGLASAASPHNAIKVYGLHVNAASQEQQTTAVQKADSISSSAKTSSTIEEREKSKPPACARARFIRYGVIASAVAIAIALIRRRLKK